MFKSWRSEKKKFKAIFKLQFQATQVPQLKKSALMVSLIPEDVGKPTFKLEKAAVQNGTCTWENPIYVSVKLIREPKTGKINEKIYHFIVSSGSSKAGFLGEASIDFAEFVAETEPLTVSLPLKFANSGAVLHVTIQRIQEATDPRYTEENGDPTLQQDKSLMCQESNYHFDGTNQNFAKDQHLNTCTSQNAEQNHILTASTSFNATLASCWEISSEPKTPQDRQDPASFQSPLRQTSLPQKGTFDAITIKKRGHQRSTSEWSVGSTPDGSLVDSANSPEDLPRELQEISNDSTERLQSEMVNLMRQAEVSELEIQSLRKQIVKESKWAQDLSRQIIDLKEERDTLKAECVELKSLQKRNFDRAKAPSQLGDENKDSRVLLEEIRRELSYEKDLNTNLKLQLQKTQDSNSELILAVRELDEMLKQKNMEISCLPNKRELSKNVEDLQPKNSECNMNENQQSLEELVQKHSNPNEIHTLRKKITDLCGEIDVYREHREKLQMHIEQLTQDYEDLAQENQEISSKLEQSQNECSDSLAAIKELECQVGRLEGKLKKQSQVFSESLFSINELESQVKGLERELEKQAQGFENDLDAMTHAKFEQEQRAIRAEEALKKTRWKNAATAERLQEEFSKLSVEMAGKIDENEKLTVKALTEADDLRLQKRNLEDMLRKANEELRRIQDQDRAKLEELSSEIDLKEKQIEKMSWEIDDKSHQLRDAKKDEEGEHKGLSMEIQMLRAKIERSKKDGCDICEHAEMRDETEKMKTKTEETDMLIQRWNKERDELVKKLDLANKEAEKTQEELISLQSLRDEKETMVGTLQSEVEKLRAQYIELKHDLVEEQLEKEHLRKLVFQIKGELQKKEEEIFSIERQLKDKRRQATVLDEMSMAVPQESKEAASWKEELKFIEKTKSAATFTATVNERGDTGEGIPGQKICGIAPLVRREETLLAQELKVSTLHTIDEQNLTELLTEVTLLKERNKSMENELKEMQERYSEISLKFAQVEGERQQLVMTIRNLKNGKKT